MNRAFIALEGTILILLVVPCIGFINDWFINIIIRRMYYTFGSKLTKFIANYLTFIGTVHHELSHAITAFCTGAKVTKIELFYPSGPTLGRVSFIPRGNRITKSIQLTLSAIAPVILGCVTEYILIKYVIANSNGIILTVIIYYLIFSIFLHMTMSKQDTKNAIKGLPICTLLIFCVLFATKINIVSLLSAI